jgi:hypothetical protein
MNHIQPADEQIGNTNKKEKTVREELSGIPRCNENSKGNDNGKQFRKVMKKEVMVKIGDIESGRCRRYD